MAQPFDSRKNALNIAVHGLSFENIDELDWDMAITSKDTRADYGEERFITYAMRRDRLHCLV